MSLKQILYDLFLGQEFQGVKADIKKILADIGLLSVAMATLSQEVAALDLGGLTSKVDMLLKPSQSIWTGSVSFQAAPEIVNVPVIVKGEPLAEITAFGFTLLYDSAELRFVSATAGVGTASWQAVDGNETQPGQVIVGGFAGGGVAVAGENISEIVILQFEVLVDYDVPFQINTYVDDIAGMQPEPYYGVILKAVN